MPRAIQNWIGGATASTQIWCPGTSMHDAEQFDEIRQQSTRLSEFRRERRLWPTHLRRTQKMEDIIRWKQYNISYAQCEQQHFCVGIVLKNNMWRRMKNNRGGRFLVRQCSMIQNIHSGICCNFNIIFNRVIGPFVVKIYIGNPYTIRRVSSRGVWW